jgi:L-rhamnose mutarotase
MYEYMVAFPRIMVKRYCKTLELKNDPEIIETYKKAHAPGAAWPEITQGMSEIGILDMEIYLDGTRLFMVMDTIPEFNHEQAMHELSKKPRQAEWEAWVSCFQKASVDSSAGQKWRLMERIFKFVP